MSPQSLTGLLSAIFAGKIAKKAGRQRTVGLLRMSQTNILMHAGKDQASQLHDTGTRPRFTACSLQISKISTSYRRCQTLKATELTAYHKRKQYALLTWSMMLRQSHQNHHLSPTRSMPGCTLQGSTNRVAEKLIAGTYTCRSTRSL